MLTSTEPTSDTVVSARSVSQERLLQLESELKASRAREELSRTVLDELRTELDSAYSRISQQQAKLKTLVTTLQASRASSYTTPSSPSITDAEIARPTHLYRRLIRQDNPTVAPTPATRQPITGTESCPPPPAARERASPVPRA